MQKYDVMTVCTGNICRSVMGEVVLKEFVSRAGLSDVINVDSTGVSSEERGNPVDFRAQNALAARGYTVPSHRARKITRQEALDQDLLLAMTRGHFNRLMDLVPEKADSIYMYRWFEDVDGAAEVKPTNSQHIADDLEDPWYGGPKDFEVALDQLEASAQSIVDFIRKQLHN